MYPQFRLDPGIQCRWWGVATVVQISYQVGHYPTAKQACEVLWDHFLAPPPPPEGITFITEAKRDFKLTLLKSVHKYSRSLLWLFQGCLSGHAGFVERRMYEESVLRRSYFCVTVCLCDRTEKCRYPCYELHGVTYNGCHHPAPIPLSHTHIHT